MDKVQKEQIIQQVREKYTGTLYELSPAIDSEVFVLYRPATRMECIQFRADRDNDSKRNEADFGLCCACALYPDRGGVDRVFDSYPFFASQWAGEIIHKSGGGSAESKKV